MLRSILVVAALVIASELLRAEVTKVDVATLEQLREAGVPVIDIRTPEEWNHTGVIDGSHLLTFADAGGHYDIDEWASRLAAIVAPKEPIALICGSGRRSSIASRILDRQFAYEREFTLCRPAAFRNHQGGDRRRHRPDELHTRSHRDRDRLLRVDGRNLPLGARCHPPRPSGSRAQSEAFEMALGQARHCSAGIAHRDATARKRVHRDRQGHVAAIHSVGA